MLTCLPQGICSWKFTIPEAGNAEVELFSFSRRGIIRLEGVEYAVAGSGILSSTWTLTRGQECVSTAGRGGKLFSANIELRAAQESWLLVPKGLLQSSVEIRCGPETIGVIATVHSFTRRATIECSNDMPLLQQLFAFWLAAEIWRARSNSSGGG